MSSALSNDGEANKQKQNGLVSRDSEEGLGKFWNRIYILIKRFTENFLTLVFSLKICIFLF